MGDGVYEVSATEILQWKISSYEPAIQRAILDVGVGSHVAVGDIVGQVLNTGDYPIVAPLSGEIVAVTGYFPRDPGWTQEEYDEAYEGFADNDGFAYQGWLFRVRAEEPLPALRDSPPETTADF